MTIAYIFMHVVKQIKQTKGMEIDGGGESGGHFM